MANVCPICNNPLRQYGKDFYVCEVCETYFDKNENIVLTEQEWLQTATTEQLADLMSRMVGCSNCPIPKDGRSCMGTYSGCWHEIIKWLKQPHHEKE